MLTFQNKNMGNASCQNYLWIINKRLDSVRGLIIHFSHFSTFYCLSKLYSLAKGFLCVCGICTCQWTKIQFLRDVPLCGVRNGELRTQWQSVTPLTNFIFTTTAVITSNLAQATTIISTHKLLVFVATGRRLRTSSRSFSMTQFAFGWPRREHRWINGERGFLKVVVTKGILCSNTLYRVIRKEPSNQKLNYRERAFYTS